MGDTAAQQAALLPESTASKPVPTTTSSANGKQATNGGSKADMTADDAAGCCKRGVGEEISVTHESPIESPLKGGGVDDTALPRSVSPATQPPEAPQDGVADCLPRSVSSVTQPEAPGDTFASGAGMLVPVEAETPQRPERRQEAPSDTLPSRPPIQTVGSNAESEVGSWEGAVEPTQRSSPVAPSRSTRSGELDPAAWMTVAVGDEKDKGPAGALPQPTKGTKPGHPPVSPQRVLDGGEDGARSGEEKEDVEAKEEVVSSPDPIDRGGPTASDAAGAGESGESVGDCAVDSPSSVGPEGTAAPPDSLPSPGEVRADEEDAAAVASASATPDSTLALSPAAAAATSDTKTAAPDATEALPVSPAAVKDEQEEDEQVVVTGNSPLYQNGLELVASSRPGGPSGASCGTSTGGWSTTFSPVSMGTSGGNAAADKDKDDHDDDDDRGGAAAAEASTDPTISNTDSSSPPRAATMLARFRNAALGGSAGLFSRRAAVGPDRPLPPAPDAGPAETAPPRSEAVAGSNGSITGTNLPPLPSHKSLFDSVNGGGKDGDAGWGKGKAPASGDGEALGKTPLMSPLRSGTASAAATPARPRREVEGDVEEGGARAAVAAAVAVDGGVAAAAAVATEPGDSQVVLPCAPSDEEKVLYDKTGRAALVVCAIVAFVTLTWGLWLFTLVMPAFYWFGAPATFLVFYTAAHYFAVAMWGKDFDPDDHAEVVRRSTEKRYRPTVDVFLPVCKEPLHLLANTWRHVQALDYPDVKVFVLDDGRSDEVKALAASFGFEYVLRADAPALKKAGNLRNAFARTSGDAIAIFDADFCPRPDFLKETVPYLGDDPSVGIVQTPQFFRHRSEQTWIEKGAGASQEFFYRMVQVNQDRFNAAVCVGSCGLYRRAALEPLGGMAAIEHSEDMYTGFKMTENGFKIKYVPLALAMGICPDEPQSFFMQQYRWCMGSCTLVTEKGFWQSNISKIHKLCFLNGLLYYIATALLVFMAPMPILLLVWAAADGVLWYHSGFVLPSIIFASVVMPLWSRQPYGMSCHRVKVIQCYAHMFAIKDSFMGRSAPWVPSGHGRSRLSSSTYKSSVRLLIGWNVLITALIVGGSAWRMTMLTWYHFLPAVVVAVGSFALNVSTLVY